MKTKIVLSDEGFGYIVRQRTVITELLKLKPELGITLQTHQHWKTTYMCSKFLIIINLLKKIKERL